MASGHTPSLQLTYNSGTLKSIACLKLVCFVGMCKWSLLKVLSTVVPLLQRLPVSRASDESGNLHIQLGLGDVGVVLGD